MPKKIVILGPESTGKSVLSEQLAAHFKTEWCPEYAREYLLKNGTKYSFEDLLLIAKGQIALEDSFSSRMGADQMLFIDTDMYVMKVWCEFVFEKCHRYILQQIASRQYDLYLLCDTDLPWTKDELREYPDLASRRKLFHTYKDLLVNQDVPWRLVQGRQNERRASAIGAVNFFL